MFNPGTGFTQFYNNGTGESTIQGDLVGNVTGTASGNLVASDLTTLNNKTANLNADSTTFTGNVVGNVTGTVSTTNNHHFFSSSGGFGGLIRTETITPKVIYCSGTLPSHAGIVTNDLFLQVAFDSGMNAVTKTVNKIWSVTGVYETAAGGVVQIPDSEITIGTHVSNGYFVTVTANSSSAGRPFQIRIEYTS